MAEDKLVAPQDHLPPKAETAPEILKKFLEEKGIEIRLTPPMVRQVDGGGLMIDQPQILADFKKANSIATN